jgi:hypothetical protein
MKRLDVFFFGVFVFLFQLQPVAAPAAEGRTYPASSGPTIPTDPERLGDPQRAGFRGQIGDVKWIQPPADVATLAAGPDIDLVAMGRWAQHYLIHNTNPKLNYACRFSLDWSCPPAAWAQGEDLVAHGDTDCRMDWEFMFMAEMCGVGQTADAAAGVRRRILSYLGNDNLAHAPGASSCGGVPPGKIFVSPWATGKIMVSLAETFARTGDQAAKQRARKLFEGLRGLSNWDTGRAWYVGGGGPYLDGKWYDTFGTVGYSCSTEPVIRYWELTGDPEALDFARARARGTVDGLQANLGCRRIRPDGSFSDQTHLHMHEVWGVAHVGAAVHDPRLIEWARRVYEYVRSRGTDYGWFSERMILGNEKPWTHSDIGNTLFPERLHLSETCVTGDMVSVAACLARGGYPEYWDHVDRYVRNYVRAMQFIMTPKIEAYYRKKWQGKPEKDIEVALKAIRRYQGGCGASAAVNGGPESWVPCGCCGPEGIRCMYTAWKNAVVEDARGVWVNMSFNRETPAVVVRSFLPAVGRLAATPRKPGDFYLRPPSWTPRSAVQTFRNGKSSTPVWWDDYVLFAKAVPGEELAIAYPLPEFVQKVGVGGKLEEQRPYQVRWRGNTCLGVQPRAVEFPFFEDVLPVLPEPPKE